MTQEPRPLPSGTLLGGRFEVVRMLGRGGFGIVYLTRDTVRHDEATIKELAPFGCLRSESGLLDLDTGGVSSHRLRQSFLDEARLLARLNVPGILPIRAVFTENGTAYYGTDQLAQGETLESLLAREGRMNAEGALDILLQLLETLEAVHGKGILHRDIKPSNVLISPKGQVYLIDFGSAREWHADESTRHTVLYTPGYAPLEQLSEKGRRGPATDLYALCATAYRMLTGSIPTPATDRINGAPLIPIMSIRPDLDSTVAGAIEAGLALQVHDRPQSVAEFRNRLSDFEDRTDPGNLAIVDAKLIKLQRFGFDRRQCPACGGVLDQPKPLRKWTCPVCRDGMIRRREIAVRLCPACRVGTLHKVVNDKPLAFCPMCRTGRLARRGRGLVHREVFFDCPQCKVTYAVGGKGLTLSPPSPDYPNPLSDQEARDLSERSAEVWLCDGCEAQFDLLEDGRWGQVSPKPRKYHALYPEEWARVAANLPPGAGNAACSVCRADYFVDNDRLTLLSSEIDPHRFAAEHLGRLIDAESARWLGVGKDSPSPGLVCSECLTELDFDGDYLRLVKTKHRRLVRLVGQPKKLIDWHRIALGLPEVHEEDDFRTDVSTAIRVAYETGEIGFDAKNDVIWKGPATRDGQSGVLSVARGEITFGGLIRKWRVPADAIVNAQAHRDRLELHLSGDEEPEVFDLVPVELTVHLKSGDHSVCLNSESLALRLQAGTQTRRLVR